MIIELPKLYPRIGRFVWIPNYEIGKSIEIIVDPDNIIQESNENNNVFRGILPLPTDIPATCTPTSTTRPTGTITPTHTHTPTA